MIDNTQNAANTSPMDNEMDESELESLQDAMFHVEQSEYVASLPAASPEQEAAYNVKMKLLEDIRNEVFPAPPEPEGDHNESYDSRYAYEYSVGSH